MNTKNQTTPSTLTLFRHSLEEMTPAWLGGPVKWLLAAFLAMVYGPGLLPKPYTMMWEVTDGRHTGYVLGTIHAGKPNFYPLDPAIEHALDQSKIVSFEIDPVTIPHQTQPPPKKDPEVQRQWLYQKLVLDLRRDPAKWSDYKFKSRDARRAIITDLYNKRQEQEKPLEGYGVFANLMELAGYSFRRGVENYIYSRTKHTKSFIKAEPTELHDEHGELIEDAFYQLFDPFDPAALDAEIQASSEGLKAMWDEWQRGKVSKLRWWHYDYDIMARRNRAMATTFARLLREDQRPFMAVGAGHMGGGKGVISLLQARGLKTKRVAKIGKAQTTETKADFKQQTGGVK